MPIMASMSWAVRSCSPRAGEELRTLAGASLHERDESTQALDLGSPEGVKRAGLDRDQQLQGRLQRAGGALGPRGREQAPGPASGFGR
jgi:hypothetical protein